MTEAPSPTPDPTRWLEEHGDALYAFSMSRLRDPVVAEDLVQETFLAAMKAKERFSGRSSERTWLIGILKHKIVDFFRKSSRQKLYQDTETMEALERDQFLENGHWKKAPSRWSEHPVERFRSKEFWDVLHRCLGHLKPMHREAFTLREIDDLERDEICDTLNISESNLWVILHRARLGLRACLETNWLNEEAES